jgi:hypothetical protein
MQSSMLRVRLEPTIAVLERRKEFRDLQRAATVIGTVVVKFKIIRRFESWIPFHNQVYKMGKNCTHCARQTELVSVTRQR